MFLKVNLAYHLKNTNNCYINGTCFLIRRCELVIGKKKREREMTKKYLDKRMSVTIC